MLVSFSVSNFRSFNAEETFSMVASKRLSDHPKHVVEIPNCDESLLRTSVIYGANAAGKSNLIRAMSFAQSVIENKSDAMIAPEPFRFSGVGPRPVSSFEFRFVTNRKLFTFGFDMSGAQIHGEWFSVRHNNDENLIYERDADGNTKVYENSLSRALREDVQLVNVLGVLKQLPLKKDQLFLSRVSSLPENAQGPTLQAAIKWLTKDLVILKAEHRTPNLLSQITENDRLRLFSQRFLNRVGTGISGLHVEERERDAEDWERNFLQSPAFADGLTFPYGPDLEIKTLKDNPGRVVVRRLFSQHATASDSGTLPFGEESDGTQQLLHLMPFLVPSGKECRVVVIDELDRSLHPLLCWEFIKFFNESLPANSGQLIVTTHEAHLLNQDLLRRDEYWFVEKDRQQQTRLVPLSDFKIRKDLQLEKGYLQGRFGAIPHIGPISELMKILVDDFDTEPEDAAERTPAES